MIRNWQSTLAILFLADRLHLPRWKARIQVTGIPPNQLPVWGRRPVILVYVHVGGYCILRYWLRSQGFPTGSYVAQLPEITTTPLVNRIFAKAGASYGINKVPHTFVGSKQVRKMIKYLVPGHLLTIALDSQSDSSMIFQAAGKYPISLSSGIIRVAALSNAILLPVSVLPRGMGRFCVRFGTPIPDEWINEEQSLAATQLLLNQLWKDIEEEPSILGWGSLQQLASHLTLNHHIPFP